MPRRGWKGSRRKTAGLKCDFCRTKAKKPKGTSGSTTVPDDPRWPFLSVRTETSAVDWMHFFPCCPVCRAEGSYRRSYGFLWSDPSSISPIAFLPGTDIAGLAKSLRTSNEAMEVRLVLCLVRPLRPRFGGER